MNIKRDGWVMTVVDRKKVLVDNAEFIRDLLRAYKSEVERSTIPDGPFVFECMCEECRGENA